MHPTRTRRVGLAASLFTALAVAGAGPPPAARPVTYPIPAMGTYVHVTVMTSDSAASFADASAAPAQIRLVGSLMTNWTSTSEVARINRVADSAATTVQPPGAGVDTIWVKVALKERFTLEPSASSLFVVRYY